MTVSAAREMAVQGVSYNFNMNGVWLTASYEMHTVVGEGNIARMLAGIDRRAIGYVHLTLTDGTDAMASPDTLIAMWA